MESSLVKVDALWNYAPPYMSRSGSARAAGRKEAYHHGDLRRALLDATLRLVDQKGPQGFTLRAAARAAGVTPSATYHHFEDKDALLAAVAEEGFDLFRVALEAAANQPARSARERSRNVGVGYVLFAVKHPTRFRVMVGYGVQERLSRGQLGPRARATYEVVRDVLIAGLKRSDDEVISDAEVLGWWSVVHGLAFLAIDGHLGEAGTSHKRVDTVVRAVIEALDRRGGR
jgi:AcrR family transcriptional regulator